jgi:citrate lyase subunit beta-like protein
MAAIDMVCVEFRNHQVLEAESAEGRTFGFTGKQIIHPSQIDPVNQTFSPSLKQVERAKQLLETYEKHSKIGKGAFEFEGIVIDLPSTPTTHIV